MKQTSKQANKQASNIMQFSSEGFDLDAMGDKNPKQKQEQEVVYEIGGGATRITKPESSPSSPSTPPPKTKERHSTTTDSSSTSSSSTSTSLLLSTANSYKEEGNVAYRQQDWDTAQICYTKAIDTIPGHPTGKELLQLQKEWKEQEHARARKVLQERDEKTRQERKQQQQKQQQQDKQEQQQDKQTQENSQQQTKEEVDDTPNEDKNTPTTTTTTTTTETLVFQPPCQHPHGETLAIFHANRAAVFIQLQHYDKAIEDCTVSILLHSKYIKAWVRRGQAYEQKEQYDLALSDAKTVLTLATQHQKQNQQQQQPSPSTLSTTTRTTTTTISTQQLRQYHQAVQRLEQLEAKRLEQLKTETMDKLKDLGNSILGNFGLSLDNFKAVQDPQTGSYSISFDQQQQQQQTTTTKQTM